MLEYLKRCSQVKGEIDDLIDPEETLSESDDDSEGDDDGYYSEDD